MTHRIFAAAAALAFVATPAMAQFEQEDFALTLSGQAFTDVNLDSTNVNVAGSLGYFFSDQFEAGIRQGFTYSDLAGNNSNGTTALFADYHFGEEGAEFQPFLGAALGYAYGDSTNDTFYAGPELGVKYFVDENWFVFGVAEYQFFFEDGDEADEAIDDGSFIFRLGLGVLL